MQIIDTIFMVAILIFSVVIHEVSHGYVAYKLGDPTAFYARRLTLNPLRHLDPFGSVFLPLILALSGTGVVFGWAKPVPYNPNNVKGRYGEIAVALAGIVSNITIAIIFSLILRACVYFGVSSNGLMFILPTIIIVNILLAVFNLMPIPPLDGSKVLFSLLGYRFWRARDILERYSIVFIVLFVVFVWQYIAPVVYDLFIFMTGISL